MQMCKWNRGNTVGGITDKENIMDDITDKLKKTRIIKVQQSEREKYAYVEKCFKDVSGIKEFHY